MAEIDSSNHKPYVITSILESAGGMWLAHHLTRGWGETAPFAKNNLVTPSEKFTASLPSINDGLRSV